MGELFLPRLPAGGKKYQIQACVYSTLCLPCCPHRQAPLGVDSPSSPLVTRKWELWLSGCLVSADPRSTWVSQAAAQGLKGSDEALGRDPGAARKLFFSNALLPFRNDRRVRLHEETVQQEPQ